MDIFGTCPISDVRILDAGSIRRKESGNGANELTSHLSKVFQERHLISNKIDDESRPDTQLRNAECGMPGCQDAGMLVTSRRQMEIPPTRDFHMETWQRCQKCCIVLIPFFLSFSLPPPCPPPPPSTHPVIFPRT